MMNPRSLNQRDTQRALRQSRFVATVDSTSGGLVKIIREGETVADNQFYPAAVGLAAGLGGGELVMCTQVGGMVYVDYEIATS